MGQTVAPRFGKRLRVRGVERVGFKLEGNEQGTAVDATSDDAATRRVVVTTGLAGGSGLRPRAMSRSVCSGTECTFYGRHRHVLRIHRTLMRRRAVRGEQRKREQ